MNCGRIRFLAIEGELRLFAPESVREELERILLEKLGYSEHESEETVKALPIAWVDPRIFAEWTDEAKGAIADVDDAHVVALALALGADVVSGDGAFRPLRESVVRTWRPRDSEVLRDRGP